MREHAHLAAMVGFVGDHVAQHLRANRPRFCPAVSEELFHPAIAQRFSKHLSASSGALGQCPAGLLRRAPSAVELGWNRQMRRCQPDPFGSYIVHVGEDCGDGAHTPGWFDWQLRIPGSRVKMLKDNLVHPLVYGEDLHHGEAELRTISAWTRGHSTSLPAPQDSLHHAKSPTPARDSCCRLLRRSPACS